MAAMGRVERSFPERSRGGSHERISLAQSGSARALSENPLHADYEKYIGATLIIAVTVKGAPSRLGYACMPYFQNPHQTSPALATANAVVNSSLVFVIFDTDVMIWLLRADANAIHLIEATPIAKFQS
jgi:hypothetical protein